MAGLNERQKPAPGPSKGRDSRSVPESEKTRPEKALSEDEAHIGATEEQVTPTTPPSPNDDEPKQG